MDEDLSDVGLNALEAMEAADEQAENETPADEGGEQEEQTTAEPEEVDSETEDSEPEEKESEDESGEEPEGESHDEDEKESNNEELSDEEFEKLARKRGYTKEASDDEKQKEQERSEAKEKLLERPDEIPEKVWNNMPEENRVIYNALPYLNAEGKKGTIQVKTPDQLPDDFEFKNEKAMMRFQNDLQAQENKATQLSNAIATRAEAEQRAIAEKAEARAVIGEIDKLQDKGLLPKPTAKQGTKAFDDDPAVLLINEVLDYRAQRAREGVRLSVKDSLTLYKAEHPERFAKKEAKGDAERRNVAKKIAGNSKATGTAVNNNESSKPHYYKLGMSTEDVLDAVLDDMD